MKDTAKLLPSTVNEAFIAILGEYINPSFFIMVHNENFFHTKGSLNYLLELIAFIMFKLAS